MKKFIPFIILLLITSVLGAQEFNYQVKLNFEKAQTTDPKVFESLEIALRDFLNNQKWTNDEYEPEERIDCNLQVTISEELSATSFKADIAIQATRPVFNADYQTALLSYVDKGVIFEYEAFQPLEFSDNAFNSNLTSLLGFYCYVILGLDYDSFSPFGGEEHFQKAQDILNTIPPNLTSRYKGWRSLDGNRNRYWMIESILSPRTRNMRQSMYDYHRTALDNMAADKDAGRASMHSALKELEKVSKGYPNAMIIQLFALAKGDEIIEIFKGGTRQEQNDVIRVMTRLDPSNASKYKKIRG